MLVAENIEAYALAPRKKLKMQIVKTIVVLLSLKAVGFLLRIVVGIGCMVGWI